MGEFKVPLYNYDMEVLAKSLKLESIDVIKTSSVDIESHWYRAAGPADLYFWKSNSKIVKHQVSLFGQVVEWNEFDGVKTGYVQDDDENYGSDVVCFDEEVNEVVIQQVVDFLSQVPAMDAEIVKNMISHYEFYNRWASTWIFRVLSGIFLPFRKK
ncbi:MAG: hypothetical protein HRT44_07430 [Bdellovibrionales bacterium]|nr:hypothetical protein [Bdellovibrionales bacterium]NQZ19069.1 hypothetical protein [Bdellovibrionales bacterium]